MFAKITCPTGLQIECYSEDALIFALANIQAYHECRIDSQVPLSDLIDNISPAPTAFQQHAVSIAADAAAQPDERAAFLDIVFDGPPSHESGRFVEVEDAEGRSVNAGEWIDRGNGLWALRIARATAPQASPHPEYTRGWQDCLSMYIAPQATVKGDEQAAFPYQKTFNAIAAATKVEAGHIAISVADFCKAFGAVAPQAGAAQPDGQHVNPTPAARLTHPEITVANYHWALSRVADYRYNDRVPSISNPTRTFGDGDIARLICKLIEEQETLERSELYHSQMAAVEPMEAVAGIYENQANVKADCMIAELQRECAKLRQQLNELKHG